MFGSAEHDGRLYLVMKLYDGSLDAHLRQTGPLDPLKVIEFGLQLAHTVRIAAHMISFAKTCCSGLKHETCDLLQLVSLHKQHVIIKDIKPANVLIEHTAGGTLRMVFAGKTLPLPCVAAVSTAFVDETVPFRAGFQISGSA